MKLVVTVVVLMVIVGLTSAHAPAKPKYSPEFIQKIQAVLGGKLSDFSLKIHDKKVQVTRPALIKAAKLTMDQLQLADHVHQASQRLGAVNPADSAAAAAADLAKLQEKIIDKLLENYLA